MIRPHRGRLPRLAPGVYIDESARVIGDVEIGEESSVWMCTVIRGDVNWIRIGRRSNVQDGSVVHGMHDTHPAIVGDEVTIGHGAIVHGCTIGNRVLVGMGAIVLNGAEVGDETIVAGQDSPLSKGVEGFSINGKRIGNRYAVQPMEGWDGTTTGGITEEVIRRWRRFGESGAKLILGGEAMAVRPDGRANPNQLIINEANKAELAKLREELVAAHASRFGNTEEAEYREALRQVYRIAEFRLRDTIKSP